MSVRLYSYEARDLTGNTHTGEMQAESPRVVAQQLQDQGYRVVRVAEARQPRPAAQARVRPGGKPGHALLAQFYREFATLIGSGMTVVQALHTLDETIQHPTMRWAIRGVLRGVERGQRMSENMQQFPEVFSPLVVAIVRAGEDSGRLEQMLKTLADYAEHDLELQRLLSRETFYPKILLVAILTIVPGGLTVARAITGGLLAGLQMAGLILLAYAFLLVLPAALVYLLFRAYGSSEQGRQGIARIKLRLPIFGGLVQRIAMSRFCRALAALYAGGVPIGHSMRLAGAAAGNRAVAGAVSDIVPRLERGERISEALATTGLVPQLVLSMLRTGEQTGDIDAVLHKVADYYDDETKTKIHNLAQTIVPIAVIIGAIIVLTIAAMFYLSYFGNLLSMI